MARATRLGLVALLLALPAAPAVAQDACGSFKWSVAREVAALTAPDLPTLASGAAYPALGRGVAVTLAPQAEVAYAVTPARPPKSAPAYGAQIPLPDMAGGTLQVTLSDDAWVDVVQGGKTLRSSAFSGKTGCAGVRKSVRFTLASGPASLAISDSPVPTIKLDVAPAE